MREARRQVAEDKEAIIAKELEEAQQVVESFRPSARKDDEDDDDDDARGEKVSLEKQSTAAGDQEERKTAASRCTKLTKSSKAPGNTVSTCSLEFQRF